MTVVRPVIAEITQFFDNGATATAPGHPGVDYGCAMGTYVLSVADGEVIYAGPAEGFGDHLVSIWHPSLGVTTRYGHMGAHWVNTGDQVVARQCIGLSNNEGWSTGPHLHFEVDPRWAIDGGIPSNIDGDVWLHAHGAYLDNPYSAPGQLTAHDRTVIRATQSAMQMPQTGGWGIALSNAIGFLELCVATPPHPPKRNPQVALLQTAWGFSPGDIDGIYGPATKWAFRTLAYSYINK